MMRGSSERFFLSILQTGTDLIQAVRLTFHSTVGLPLWSLAVHACRWTSLRLMAQLMALWRLALPSAAGSALMAIMVSWRARKETNPLCKPC